MRWLVGLGLCLGVTVLFLYFAMPQVQPHGFPEAKALAASICERQVRRVNLAYLAPGERGLADAQRRTARRRIIGILESLHSRPQIVDQGLLSRLNCASPPFPASPEELGVLLVERQGSLSLATLHYRPGASICRTPEVDPAGLQRIFVQHDPNSAAPETGEADLQTWIQNLPRVVSPQCREGYPLPGANIVDPHHPRASNLEGFTQ